MNAADMVRETAKSYRDDARALVIVGGDFDGETRRAFEGKAEIYRAFADDLDRLAERIEREATS